MNRPCSHQSFDPRQDDEAEHNSEDEAAECHRGRAELPCQQQVRDEDERDKLDPAASPVAMPSTATVRLAQSQMSAPSEQVDLPRYMCEHRLVSSRPRAEQLHRS